MNHSTESSKLKTNEHKQQETSTQSLLASHIPIFSDVMNKQNYHKPLDSLVFSQWDECLQESMVRSKPTLKLDQSLISPKLTQEQISTAKSLITQGYLKSPSAGILTNLNSMVINEIQTQITELREAFNKHKQRDQMQIPQEVIMDQLTQQYNFFDGKITMLEQHINNVLLNQMAHQHRKKDNQSMNQQLIQTQNLLQSKIFENNTLEQRVTKLEQDNKKLMSAVFKLTPISKLDYQTVTELVDYVDTKNTILSSIRNLEIRITSLKNKREVKQ